MRQFFLLSLLAVFAFACDPIEETNNNNVNNNTDFEICDDNLDNDQDGATDCLDSDCTSATNCQTNNVNNTNNTDPGTCNPEDLPYQALCSVGYKCTITDTAHQVGCIYDDGPLSPGEACVPVGPGRTQDGCPSGTLCYSEVGGTGSCMQFCAFLYIPCDETHMCYETIPAGAGSAYLCSSQDECDPFALSGCASGTCYVYISANYMTKCEPAGTKLKGEPCSRPGECAPRHTCYEDVCHYMCTTHDDCGIEMCQKLSSSDPYGLCM